LSKRHGTEPRPGTPASPGRSSPIRAAAPCLRSPTNDNILDVVVGRKEFYRAEGALLVWILPYFYPSYRQLTVDDLLFNNNANVLVIDNETSAISEALHRFTMRCNYRRPILLDGAWRRRGIAGSLLGTMSKSICTSRGFSLRLRSEEKAMLERQTDFVRETNKQPMINFGPICSTFAALHIRSMDRKCGPICNASWPIGSPRAKSIG